MVASPASPSPLWSAARSWLGARDPAYSALRRAARAALIMPAMFALGDTVIANPVLATFAAFGSFAMLLLVDFTGPVKDRLLDQAALGIACALLICVGTLASRTTWLAAVAMALIVAGVLFAGVVSSVLASATTALLLSFILPVSLAAPASSIPDRVAGWGLAASASLIAIAVLWPAPTRNPVRAAAIAACRALVARLRADASYLSGDRSVDAEQAHRAAIASAEDAVEKLRGVFFATPYRPTGLATDARAVIRLVDELRWLNDIVLRSIPKRHAQPNVAVCAVKLAAAEVLEQAAELLEAPQHKPEALRDALAQLQGTLADLERTTITLESADHSTRVSDRR